MPTIVPIFCCKVSPSIPSSCPSSCSVSCISPCQQHCCRERYPPNFSTQSPAICPLQCAIHCDDMCPAHCYPASYEQSSFLTKSIPMGNVQQNVLLPQSYATLTPYAPVFPRSTVYTIGPSIVALVDKSPHSYLKPRNKDHQLEGLLWFKKPIISRKLHIVCWSRLLSSQDKRCLYRSARRKHK